jgi:hypothetical protein
VALILFSFLIAGAASLAHVDVNACRSRGRIVTLEAVVPGSSVPYIATANTVGVGLRCYTTLGNTLPVGIAAASRTKLSNSLLVGEGSQKHEKFECVWPGV